MNPTIFPFTQSASLDKPLKEGGLADHLLSFCHEDAPDTREKRQLFEDQLRSRVPELDGIEVNKLGVELYQFVSLYNDYKASLV